VTRVLDQPSTAGAPTEAIAAILARGYLRLSIRRKNGQIQLDDIAQPEAPWDRPVNRRRTQEVPER